MMGVTETTIQLIRESIAKASHELMVPLEGMAGYYVALKKDESTSHQFMFEVEVDGKIVFVYIDL